MTPVVYARHKDCRGAIECPNPVIFGTGHHGNFAAELIALAGFPFCDAFHLRGMDAVDLVLVVLLLMNPLDHIQ